MRIGKLAAREWIDLCKAQSISFVHPIDLESLQKKADESPEQTPYRHAFGAFNEAGQLVSGMINWPLQVYYDGHIVGMGGIGGVVTLPEGRMHGNVRALLRHAFADMRRSGDLFSVLFPFSHRFYRRFGYEVCHQGQTYQFPTKELSNFKQTGAARMHHPGEADDPFRAVYHSFANRYNYAVARNDTAWERLLRGDPYKGEAYRYILSRDDRDVSYCMIRPVKIGEFQNDMLIFDYAYVDREALHDLLGFLHRLWPQFQNVRIELHSDLTLCSLLEEPDELKLSKLTHTMARVVDVQKALSLMRHPSGRGSYRIAVQDDFLPENGGVYAVSYQDHAARVSRHDEGQPHDLFVTVQTLAQLCVGYLSLQAALIKPDVKLYSNHETLCRVFVEKPRLFADRF